MQIYLNRRVTDMCWVTFKHFEHSFTDKSVLTLQHKYTIYDIILQYY